MEKSVIMEGHARSENRLSFSDLLYSIDDLHLDEDENENPNSSLDNDSFLGFFVDENNKRRNAQLAQGVVFCGKVIDTSRTTQNPNKVDSKKNNVISRSNSVGVSVGKKEGSKVTSCSSKSRFMFGSGRYPTKMELSELRSRQSKLTCSSGGKRMPVLIRVLGCVGGFQDDNCSTPTYVNVSSY